MSWTPTEKKKIDGICDSVEAIEAAIVGDLKKDKPGLQDKVRDLNVANDANLKQHRYLFLMGGFTLVGIAWLSLDGSISTLIEYVLRIL